MSAEQLLYRAINPSPAKVRSVDSEPNLQRTYCTIFLKMFKEINVAEYCVQTHLSDGTSHLSPGNPRTPQLPICMIMPS
ncbi:hypothetical protein J6590_083902 [Homalodisca vitripennis]|nr:hypothetical protein J6590_083902 [Homalodisca vitripennis]